MNIFVVQCSYNRIFWQEVSKLIQIACDINKRFYDLDILFGIPLKEDILKIYLKKIYLG